MKLWAPVDRLTEAEDGRTGLALLAAVLAAAFAFRFYLLATTDFPLNDGGLFYEFVRSVSNAFPRLPAAIEYNGFSIPFAYPPLSFWLGAALTKLGVAPIEVVRVMPILLNILYIGLFALLLLRSGHSKLFAAVALLFFCTRIRSFEWLVMGGGLSRGFGSVFFLLTLLAVMPRSPGRADRPIGASILAGAAVAGTILSHLEWGILAAAAVVLANAIRSSTVPAFVRDTATTAAVAGILIAPWLAAVVASHGLDPFFAASGTAKWNLGSLVEQAVFLVRTAVTNPLIPLGAVALVKSRQPFWLGLLLLIVVLTPRHASTAASLPLAVLAAGGTFAAYRLFLRYTRTSTPAVLAAASLVLLFNAVRLYRDVPSYHLSVRPLSNDERAAMTFVSRRPTGSYLVVTSAAWEFDRAAEWFPVLTGASNRSTVQGTEWLGGDAFGRQVALAAKLKASVTCGDLFEAVAQYRKVDFVWAEVGQHCFRRAGYRPIFATREVMIFRVPAALRNGGSPVAS